MQFPQNIATRFPQLEQKLVQHHKIIVSILIFLCLIGGTYLGYLVTSRTPKGQSDTIASMQEISDVDQNVSYSDIVPSPPSDLDEHLTITTGEVTADSKHIGVLLLGYGGAGHEGGYLTDTIILAYLDVEKSKLALIHIPRDLWVHIELGETKIPMKINGTLAMGTRSDNYPTTTASSDAVLRASSLTKQAVTTVTGLPIHFVTGVDFNGFARAIDDLGGVEVTLATSFNDPWYPVKGRELELCGHTGEEVTEMTATMSGFMLEKQFPCRYENLYFPAGENSMNGETALKYARSRHTSSDFDRGRRQIEIVDAVKDKLLSLKAYENIPKFYKTFSRSVKTDVTEAQIGILVPIIKSLPNMEVVQIGLDTENVLRTGTASSGAFILLPKEGDGQWGEVQKYIASEIEKG